MQKRVQKLITFSPQLYNLVDEKAQRLGVSFPEYIRSLAVTDIKEAGVPDLAVSPELEEEIGASLADAKAGKTVEFDPENPKEMDALFEESEKSL